MRARAESAFSIVLVTLAAIPMMGADTAAPKAKNAAPSTTFRASDLLDAKSLRGPEYTVEEQVPVVDSRYSFTLRTPYGQIPALGRNLLELRISEMPAITRAEAMTKQSQELEGVKDSIKGTGKGLKALLTEPGKAISSVPKGVGRKVKEMTDKSSRQAGGETGRRFAAELGCDPETRNPVLKKLLKELSLRRQIGSGAVSVAGAFATGGMAMVVKGSSAMRTTAEMQETLRSTPLYKINEGIRGELIGAGVQKELAERFIEHESYTTLQRMLFLAQFQKIERIPNAVLLVEAAVETLSEPEALDVISTMELLAEVNSVKPIGRLLAAGLPATAQLRAGGIVVITSADYLLPNSEFTNRLAALQREHAAQPITLLAAGRISPAVKASLEAAKVQVIENGDFARLK